jgi:hypothetical protein
VRIDRGAQEVILGTGETVTYDRLILATGSSAMVPPIEGFGMPGTFVMREADDALAIRAFAQEHPARTRSSPVVACSVSRRRMPPQARHEGRRAGAFEWRCAASSTSAAPPSFRSTSKAGLRL